MPKFELDDINPLESAQLKAAINKYSLLLTEIRRRIFITLAVFAVAMILGFVFYEKIIKFLIGSLDLSGVNIVFTSPFQFINLAISCGLATGFLFTFPLIIYQVLSFIRPALKRREYKMVVSLLPFSIALFIIGFLFGALVMKWQIQIFVERSVSLGIGNVLDISKLLSVILLTSTFLGIGFQFPVILLILMRIGIIKHHQLAKKRLWIYLGSFIFAIILPADSILADILLALPLIFLFEATLMINRFLGKRESSTRQIGAEVV